MEAIEFVDASGNLRNIETDGIIVSGRFRPEAALLKQSHLEVDSGSGGPVIDQFGQCSDPGYYSTGNLLGPAETSGWCWQEGLETAKWIAQDLMGQKYEVTKSVRINTSDSAIKFIVPQRITISDRPGGMSRMQVSLFSPIKGQLQAFVSGQCILQKRIHSRPLRRILIPMKPVLQNHPGNTIEMSIRKGL